LSLRVEHLDPDRHERSAFDSGRASLDDWLRKYAHQNDAKANTGRTWVAVDDDGSSGARGRIPIVGYVTIAAHAVTTEQARAAVPKGSLPELVPAALIARLAVDREYQGRSLGGRLLRFAVERILAANAEVAVTLVVVDAIDDSAAAFYTHHGFIPVPGTSRLLARVSDLRSAFER
jgi:GNAT superfamily N-acetyltransferase